jgi:hypothetical protein
MEIVKYAHFCMHQSLSVKSMKASHVGIIWKIEL